MARKQRAEVGVVCGACNQANCGSVMHLAAFSSPRAVRITGSDDDIVIPWIGLWATGFTLCHTISELSQRRMGNNTEQEDA